ncbi:PaaI family thioesterase [Actinocorallia sp. A-T 12471]|uniref:PaaI family thioesterase n=1 Tax=Actinocorallia sp. A-T 12471 TaxID=3089813 RepID=UPI0029D377FA|nr:PaaI family thioesterase [Actinocorallia sp. A-T 12471]MDX6738972.1 PaaI family thioesterase [Actinocorallia sp. A-T 12471]
MSSELELWKTLSGAELLCAMADGRISDGLGHVAHYVGQTVVEAEPGKVVLGWTPTEKLCNPGGTAHGGFIALVLDNAVGLAAASLGERFVPQLTLNLNIDYLRVVNKGVPYLVTGTVTHHGRRRTVCAGAITDPDGVLVASATASTTPNKAFERGLGSLNGA